MKDVFELADDLGPHKVAYVHEPNIGLKGILVVDNVATGPSIGGLRMAEDVSLEECARLARAMTFKNAVAEIPHGGGKSVLFGDPKMPRARKEALIRGFARALRDEGDYIFGPDMGTDEESMAWVRDEIGRSVGLPRELGGIPLDEIGATGWGLSHVADVAVQFCACKLEGARVAVQGFGAVGFHAARFLTERGAVLVAAADSRGAIHHRNGLKPEELRDWKRSGESLAGFPGGERLNRDGIIDVECDIWIPAARPDVISKKNVDRLRTRLVIEGANIPVTHGAERLLHERGVLVVPDFVANAGGVICAAMEYQGATEGMAFQTIEEKLRHNTRVVLENAAAKGLMPREAAEELALQRVKQAMSYRRFSLCSSAPSYL
jgi:glutamate dehydrogenase (NAD(P)+)